MQPGDGVLNAQTAGSSPTCHHLEVATGHAWSLVGAQLSFGEIRSHPADSGQVAHRLVVVVRMPARALTVVVRSLSLSRLGCLAMFALGYRAHGLSSGLVCRTVGTAGAASRGSRRTGTAAAGIASTAASAVHDGVAHPTSGRRRRPRGGDVVVARSGAEGGGEAVATVKPEERKWLGNGPDPMASTEKGRQWEGPATAGGRGAQERIWMGNGPDPMAAALPLEQATAEAENQGSSVPTEEIWLNGPFKAPMPPGPLVSRTEEDGPAFQRFVVQ